MLHTITTMDQIHLSPARQEPVIPALPCHPIPHSVNPRDEKGTREENEEKWNTRNETRPSLAFRGSVVRLVSASALDIPIGLPTMLLFGLPGIFCYSSRRSHAQDCRLSPRMQLSKLCARVCPPSSTS